MLSPPRSAFRPARKTRASLDIVNQVRTLVAAGRLAPGERLPPERDLARLLGVGRSTLREAIRAVECLGLVVVRARSGTFVGRTLDSGNLFGANQ